MDCGSRVSLVFKAFTVLFWSISLCLSPRGQSETHVLRIFVVLILVGFMHAQFWEWAQGIILGYPFLAPFSLRPSPLGSQGSYCSTQYKVRASAPWQPSQGSVPQSVPEGRKELVSLLALASRRTKGSIGIHSRGLDVHSWGGQLIPDLPRLSWCRMGERLGSSPRICCIVMVEEGKDMNVWLCSPGERCGASPRSLHLYTKEEGRRFLVGGHRG